MNERSARPQPSTRSALASASALLLLGVLTAASLDLRDPALRGELRREVAAERAAVRQLTLTLANAVRGMVGGSDHVALTPAPAVAAAGIPGPIAPMLAGWPDTRPKGPPPVRDELHDLPPPAHLA